MNDNTVEFVLIFEYRSGVIIESFGSLEFHSFD
jgi:hypothetical protein